MAKTYSTPGVYIQEINAFPNSIVEVPTSIPVFVGYTEMAQSQDGKSLIGVPFKINSLAEFQTFFGAGLRTKFNFIAPYPPSVPGASAISQAVTAITLNGQNYGLTFAPNTRAWLFDSLRMYFSNGGGSACIVSVGCYGGGDSASFAVLATNLIAPLDTKTGCIVNLEDASTIVIPDAVALSATDCYIVYNAVLDHCGYTQNKMGIFDTLMPDPAQPDFSSLITDFRNGVISDNLRYGAAYFPWLKTDLYAGSNAINFENFNIDLSTTAAFTALCPENGASTILQHFIDFKTGYEKLNASLMAAQSANPLVPATVSAAQKAITKYLNGDTPDLAKAINTCHNALLAASPTYKSIIDAMIDMLNIMPPSGAMAGVYATVDRNEGVWKSPANMGINQVLAPTIPIDNSQQEDLNVPIDGKAVNAIRDFIGRGVLVWGARTLDGNSQDWRYISIRRTTTMIEQSLKLAARAYVFDANDANTWATVKTMMENFLTGLWKQGALLGPKPEEAFSVSVGLGTTMTPQDILDGYMKITVLLALMRPAEFLELTFQQQQQKS